LEILRETKPGLGILSGMLMLDICSSQRDLLLGCLPLRREVDATPALMVFE